MPFALLSATLIAAAPVHLLESAPLALIDPGDATWYGWEPLLADATAVILFSGGVAFGGGQQQPVIQGVLAVAGLLLYAGGGPLLHLARGRPTTALIDLGLRGGLPVAGLIAGLGVGLLVAGPLAGQWIFPSFLLGFLAAIITDAVGLSWDAREERASLDPAAPGWTPFIGAARGGPVAGLAGRF